MHLPIRYTQPIYIYTLPFGYLLNILWLNTKMLFNLAITSEDVTQYTGQPDMLRGSKSHLLSS